MEQFSLDKWLQDKSRKVVTRNGRPVRIVCWDRLGDYPIIGCVKYSDDYEDLESYDINGFKYSFDREDQNDLFFADEEDELTEFEKKLKEVLYEHATTNTSSEEKARQYAPELLDLARKELNLVDNTCGEYALNEAYKQGKQDALKDLPKWKKAKNDEELDCHVAIQQDNRVVLSDFVQKDEYYITLDVLKTLPKEE